MKHLKIVASSLFTALLIACSGGESKKVLIMTSGKLTVNSDDQTNIKVEPGTTHNEQEILLAGGDKKTLTVQLPDGNKTYDLNDQGYYVLNLKPDTLVGGSVRYGTTGVPTNLTNEQVDHIIDSTSKLMMGQNVTEGSKSYFIAPFTLQKISSSAESKVIGPYKGIPQSVAMDSEGKSPEMYKLFTNKQKREALNDLIKQRGSSN